MALKNLFIPAPTPYEKAHAEAKKKADAEAKKKADAEAKKKAEAEEQKRFDETVEKIKKEIEDAQRKSSSKDEPFFIIKESDTNSEDSKHLVDSFVEKNEAKAKTEAKKKTKAEDSMWQFISSIKDEDLKTRCQIAYSRLISARTVLDFAEQSRDSNFIAIAKSDLEQIEAEMQNLYLQAESETSGMTFGDLLNTLIGKQSVLSALARYLMPSGFTSTKDVIDFLSDKKIKDIIDAELRH